MHILEFHIYLSNFILLDRDHACVLHEVMYNQCYCTHDHGIIPGMQHANIT